MSVSPVTQPARPAPSSAPSAGHAPTHEAKSLADEFAAAARKGQLPLGADKGTGGKGGKTVRLGPDGKPLPPPATTIAKSLGGARGMGDALAESFRDDQPATAGMLQPMPLGVAPGMPVQAPPPGTQHVDPGAFADMLTRIWTREQGRTAKEVRVSFGDAAWPATGAKLLRLEDGSLRVTVSVGYRGAELGGSLDGLRERLASRGLTVSDVAIEDDAA